QPSFSSASKQSNMDWELLLPVGLLHKCVENGSLFAAQPTSHAMASSAYPDDRQCRTTRASGGSPPHRVIASHPCRSLELIKSQNQLRDLPNPNLCLKRTFNFSIDPPTSNANLFVYAPRSKTATPS